MKSATWLVPAILGILPASLGAQPNANPYLRPPAPTTWHDATHRPGHWPHSLPNDSYRWQERHNPHAKGSDPFPHGDKADFFPPANRHEFFWFQRPYPFHFDYYRMRYGGSYEPYFGNLYGPPRNFNFFYQPPFFGP